MRRTHATIILLLLLIPLAGCQTVRHAKCDTERPLKTLPWLAAIVKDMEKDMVKNNDAEIYLHTYYNRPVFYIRNRCCDQPNELFDCQGNKICEPDGGITGLGDNRCNDFFEKREQGTLLWPVKEKKMSP